jgi:hypothetical protein
MIEKKRFPMVAAACESLEVTDLAMATRMAAEFNALSDAEREARVKRHDHAVRQRARLAVPPLTQENDARIRELGNDLLPVCLMVNRTTFLAAPRKLERR